MLVLAAARDEIAVEGDGAEVVLAGHGRARGRRDGFADFGFFVGRENVGNLARVEQGVNVLEEGLVLDLRVVEQKDNLLVLLPGAPQHLLQVVLPLDQTVLLGDLGLEQRALAQRRRCAGA